MKFHLVPIGEKFTYKGDVYTKSGPIAASAEANGANRMIARSANVTLSNLIEPVENTVISKKLVPVNEVINIINNYKTQYHESVEYLGNDLSESNFDGFKAKTSHLIEEVLDKLNKL